MIREDIFTLISIFCDVDDFCKQFEPEWNKILIENLGQDKKSRISGIVAYSYDPHQPSIRLTRRERKFFSDKWIQLSSFE